MSRRQSKEMTLQEMQAKNTIIYDCSIDLRIETPRYKGVRVMRSDRTTLLAIAHEFVSKYPEYKFMFDTIYMILKKTLSVTKQNFNVLKTDKSRLALDKSCQDSGHILERYCPKNTPIFYDAVKYSGQINEDYYGSGPVILDCNVKWFLSPGIYAGKDVYAEHGFPIDNYKNKDKEDPGVILDWCDELGEEEIKAFDLGKRWEWIGQGFQQNQNYLDYSKNKWELLRGVRERGEYF